MDDNSLTSLTVDLLAAFVANNNVRSEDLPNLIQSTHEALSGLNKPTVEGQEDAAPAYEPAVTVRKSLASPEHIISMIDGKPYRSLKRHLTAHGLTPAEYRERYGLKPDYPMVAPAYSEARRDVAKRLGLGRKPKAAAQEAEPAQAPKKAGRKPRGISEAKAAAKQHLEGATAE